MRAKHFLGILFAVFLIAGALPAAAGTFSSGSTGANGAFPPTTPPGGTTGISLNLNTGVVTYTPSGTTATLPNVPGGGFQNGIFNFTTITVASGITLTFVKGTSNPPLTFLASGAVTIAGVITLNGSAGAAAVLWVSALSCNGGASGPGGHNGGCGATVIPSPAGTWGARGLGPGGGTGGSVWGSYMCGGGGGGSGAAGSNAPLSGCTAGTVGQGGAAYGHASLLPLLGGSGGGGGGMVYGHTGGGGGGAGGAILIASSGTLTLSSSITANGGAGGAPLANGGGGGGGAGGGVRLMATTIAASGSASIYVTAGAGGGGAGAVGRIRLEAYTFTGSIYFGASPSLTTPGSTTLSGNPT